MRRNSNPKQARAIYIHISAVTKVKKAEEVETVVLVGVLEYNKQTELSSHSTQLLIISAQLRHDEPDK